MNILDKSLAEPPRGTKSNKLGKLNSFRLSWQTWKPENIIYNIWGWWQSTMLNDWESTYAEFTIENSKEKPRSSYTMGNNRKLNSRKLKCSPESLSIPLSPTHTYPECSNLTVTVYSSITVNCSFGNLAGLHILPIFRPSSPPFSLFFHKAISA